MELAQFARVFNLTNPAEKNERGNLLARGSVLNASLYMDGDMFYGMVPDNYRLVEEWCMFPYRMVWADDERREILTFAEGDVILAVCPTDIGYIREVQDAAECYEPAWRRRQQS